MKLKIMIMIATMMTLWTLEAQDHICKDTNIVRQVKNSLNKKGIAVQSLEVINHKSIKSGSVIACTARSKRPVYKYEIHYYIDLYSKNIELISYGDI